MPISLLIALLIAFGMEFPGPEVSGSSVPLRLLEAAGGVLVIALLAFGLGGWVASRISYFGYATSRVCRRYMQGARLLTVAGLGVYAWIIHYVGWSKLVLSTWGLQGLILADDLAVLFPYMLIQLLVWSGLYFAERALHDIRGFPKLPFFLALKTRQAVGLVMPVVLIFVLRQDLIARVWPQWHRSPAAEPLELAGLGLLVLIVSPLFIRLAWPTRSLPDGPLRQRLQSVARRVGFRFNDLLVWDTGNLMVNACVTGVLPGFRYVLLSDVLIDTLSPDEVAAVFGHEVGHVAHRHLPFFGFFFLGSLGVLSLIARFCSIPPAWIAAIPWIPPDQLSNVGEIVEAAAILGCLGAFFWLVFGHLSRRFERQADVFGCKVVSCGSSECPPHVEPGTGTQADGREHRGAQGLAICPEGVGTFARALASVARQNGIDAGARSWRHGSIRHRLAFLDRLQANPSSERDFQSGVRWYRVILSFFLVAALMLAIATRSWEFLR